jgi:hypothetical protein
MAGGGRRNFCFFFNLIVSRKKKKARKREKRQSFETYFLALFVGITQAPSCNVNSLRQQQHQHPSAVATRVTSATLATLTVAMITEKLTCKEICYFQHEITESGVFLELNCNERRK